MGGSMWRSVRQYGDVGARRLVPQPVILAARFHDLRHTAASLWLAAGADPKVVQRLLGHAPGGGQVLPAGGQCATRRLWAGSGAGTVLVVIMAVPMPARFTTGGPCPRRHHHGLTLLSATWLGWPGTPRWRGRDYLWCWPEWLIRGTAGACA